MTSDQLDALIKKPKTAINWTGWIAMHNHAGHMAGTCELMDPQGLVIPRVTLECRVRAGAIVSSCYYVIGLMERVGPKRRRVLQLEVYPRERRSHNGLTVIYGPHIHRLEDEPTPVTDLDVNCGSWLKCLDWFLITSGITGHNIQKPDTP